MEEFKKGLLDYAGFEIPSEMQGESLRDRVKGPSDAWRDAVYYTYYEYPSIHMVKWHCWVSTKRYKLRILRKWILFMRNRHMQKAGIINAKN